MTEEPRRPEEHILQYFRSRPASYNQSLAFGIIGFTDIR
jgi:hypothetical protein